MAKLVSVSSEHPYVVFKHKGQHHVGKVLRDEEVLLCAGYKYPIPGDPVYARRAWDRAEDAQRFADAYHKNPATAPDMVWVMEREGMGEMIVDTVIGMRRA